MICTKCKKDLPEDFFAVKRNKRSTKCKSCKNIDYKSYYLLNKDKCVERSKKSNKLIREEIDRIIMMAKDKPCADCKNIYPTCVMDFDHLPGTNKVDNVSNFKHKCSKKLLLEEIAKCEVVCSNCHRIRTEKRKN